VSYADVTCITLLDDRINLRLDPIDSRLLNEACQIRGETVSTFTRRAIKIELSRLGLLPKKELRILGVN